MNESSITFSLSDKTLNIPAAFDYFTTESENFVILSSENR